MGPIWTNNIQGSLQEINEMRTSLQAESHSLRTIAAYPERGIWVYWPDIDKVFTAPDDMNHYNLVQNSRGGWMNKSHWTGGYYQHINAANTLHVFAPYNPEMYQQYKNRINQLIEQQGGN